MFKGKLVGSLGGYIDVDVCLLMKGCSLLAAPKDGAHSILDMFGSPTFHAVNLQKCRTLPKCGTFAIPHVGGKRSFYFLHLLWLEAQLVTHSERFTRWWQ